MTALALTGTVRLGDLHLQVDLRAEAGERVAVLGPNGAGKSTLLRLLAGLVGLDEGRLELAGVVVDEPATGTRSAPHERRVGWVPQERLLFPHLTVAANVGFGPGATPDRVAGLLDALGLTDLAARRPHECSGGQAQRVALARALATGPALLLLDEPSATLDVESRHLINGVLAGGGSGDDGAPATLLVTHDPVEAATLADRLVVLNGGRVEQIGAPLEVYRKPASTFVAAFIGSPAMSLLDARFENGQVMVDGHALAPVGNAPGPVTLGLRAEDLRIASTGVPMRVDYVEELGAHRIVHGAIGDQSVAVVDNGGAALAETVHVLVDPAKLHLFETSTGRRMDTRIQAEAVPAQ